MPRSIFASFAITLLFFAPSSTAAFAGSDPGAAPANTVRTAPAGATKEEVDLLRSEVAEQKQTIEELKSMVRRLADSTSRAANSADVSNDDVRLLHASYAQPVATQAVASPQAKEKPAKASNALEWTVGGTTVQLYGHTDVSYDYVDNGITPAIEAAVLPNSFNPPNSPLRGNNGWLGQVSSNLSYFGVRGSHKINNYLTGVFQFETEVGYSDIPGPTSDNQCKFCLGARDSFVGVRGTWGSVKIGKAEAPYKKVIVPVDPFYNTLGDHRSIMGNSGGDNRDEFETRIAHAAWYESPTWRGLYFSALFSPGQNRSRDNGAYPRGEPVCAGGNGVFVISNQNRANVAEAVDHGDINPCNDGAWGNVFSTALTYKGHGFYGFGAYEHHAAVNRTTDLIGVADEGAFRAGLSYTLEKTGTTGTFVYENLKRYAANAISAIDGQPVVFPALNERSRPLATMVALSQKIGKKDVFSVDWLHAGKTPGDPGECAGITAEGACNLFVTLTGISGSPTAVANTVNNKSNMYAIGLRHTLTRNMSTYFVYARQANHVDAHYDLGAVGHGVVVDKRDFTGTGIPGTRLQGVSGGLTFDF